MSAAAGSQEPRAAGLGVAGRACGLAPWLLPSWREAASEGMPRYSLNNPVFLSLLLFDAKIPHILGRLHLLLFAHKVCISVSVPCCLNFLLACSFLVRSLALFRLSDDLLL